MNAEVPFEMRYAINQGIGARRVAKQSSSAPKKKRTEEAVKRRASSAVAGKMARKTADMVCNARFARLALEQSI